MVCIYEVNRQHSSLTETKQVSQFDVAFLYSNLSFLLRFSRNASSTQGRSYPTARRSLDKWPTCMGFLLRDASISTYADPSFLLLLIIWRRRVFLHTMRTLVVWGTARIIVYRCISRFIWANVNLSTRVLYLLTTPWIWSFPWLSRHVFPPNNIFAALRSCSISCKFVNIVQYPFPDGCCFRLYILSDTFAMFRDLSQSKINARRYLLHNAGLTSGTRNSPLPRLCSNLIMQGIEDALMTVRWCRTTIK